MPDRLSVLLEPAVWKTAASSLLLLLVAVLAGLIVFRLTFRLVRRLNARAAHPLGEAILKHGSGPLRLLLPLACILFVSPSLWLPAPLKAVLRHLFSLAFIAGCAWLFTNTVLVLRDLILARFVLTAGDNLRARTVHTQVNVFTKILLVLIALFAVASMLMTFDKVRQVGVSILASAGVVGIIVGFAAQRSIAALLAGIQIAITQPIRLDDVVVVEGEWGRVEEITLTYVVIRLWDLRRLVVPISQFLERPFQNWTRVSADLLGSVFLYADYTVPVQAVREELLRILKKSPGWDGKTWALQVTSATERTVELRALMSAADAATAWDLRCAVREELLRFLQEQYPECLPRVRADLASPAAVAAGAG
ncbi:MAG: mechanosensitive ion channel domain-containing protein [Thermodesulfobacteriota bacterium]